MAKSQTTPPASSPATRKTMQANRGKNTRPELDLRRRLREAGFSGYRLHWKSAPGHPDIAFPGRRVAIFVNGCFWHRCPHCHPSHPATNYGFWADKFEATRERDARKTAELKAAGWTVITVWECELAKSPATVLEAITTVLKSRS